MLSCGDGGYGQPMEAGARGGWAEAVGLAVSIFGNNLFVRRSTLRTYCIATSGISLVYESSDHGNTGLTRYMIE